MVEESWAPPPAPRKRWGWKRLLMVGGTLLVLFHLLLTTFGIYHEHFVCNQCGMHRTAILYQIPGFDVTLGQRSKLEPTVLSQALARHGLIRAHTHTWLFAYGKGNTVSCLTGTRKKFLVYSRAGNPYAGTFLDMLVDYRGRAAAERWRHRLLNAEQQGSVHAENALLPFPTTRLSREAFDAYVHQVGSELLMCE